MYMGLKNSRKQEGNRHCGKQEGKKVGFYGW